MIDRREQMKKRVARARKARATMASIQWAVEKDERREDQGGAAVAL